MKKNVTCLYDIHKSFEENFNNGPLFSGDIPIGQLPDKTKWLSFLDYSVASPIGIPACSIMTSKGIKLMAQLGYDVLTYKTIRSVPFPAHPMPNICYVSIDHQLTKEDIGTRVIIHDSQPTSIDQLAIANSFGNASFSKDLMINDIALARASLTEGQVLIVSVFGTEQKKRSFIEDFAFTAQLAEGAGAHIIEANLSCPNIASCKPMHLDASLVYQISKRIVECIKVPLIIKVGTFENQAQLKETLCAAARAGVRGITGINTIPMQVVNNQSHNAFGNDRAVAGVSGNPIRSLALDFVKQATTIINQEKLNLVLSATGGVTKAEHFSNFLNAGATIALSATGAMWDPYLAMKYHATQSLPFLTGARKVTNQTQR